MPPELAEFFDFVRVFATIQNTGAYARAYA
jgi:hypothetical protein